MKFFKFLGMRGEGRTLALAKEDAKQKIEASLKGTYAPIVIKWRGWHGFAWRDPRGNYWSYTAVAPQDKDGVRDSCCCLMGADRNECERALIRHLVQNAWVLTDGKMPPSILSHPDDRREFVSQAQFQLAVHHAQYTLGMTDREKLHRWACDHAHEF